MSTGSDTLHLPILALQFRFHTEAPPRLPAFAGSAWRGGFGHALQRAVCVARGTPCASCLLYRSCAYPYLFETPPPPDAAKMRRYSAVPHPYVLRIEPSRNDLQYRLGLTLFGRAERYGAYVVHALQQAGRAGMGRDRQTFELQEVLQAPGPDLAAWRSAYRPDQPLELEPAAAPALPALPDSLRIRLEAPLRVRRHDCLVAPAEFRFADLFGPLLRRVSMLSYFHTDTPLEADFAGLVRAAEQIRIHEPDLRWMDWTRYSSRQQTTMEMGGIVGCFSLSGRGLEPFWPYLWLGQWTHAGKGATMGLGRYRIDAASLPRNNTAA